jgi:hypothetical protein
MKIWIDDVRPAPEGYIWVKTVHMMFNVSGMVNILPIHQNQIII